MYDFEVWLDATQFRQGFHDTQLESSCLKCWSTFQEILPQMDEDDGPWFKSRTSRTIASRIWFHLLTQYYKKRLTTEPNSWITVLRLFDIYPETAVYV